MHVIVVNEKDLGFNDSQIKEHKRQYNGCTGSGTPTFSMDSDLIDGNRIPAKKKSKSLPQIIPAFGLLMSILSVICFSLGSLIVKVLKDLHSLEILFIRCSFQLAFYIIPVIYQRLPLFGVSGHRIDLAIRAVCGTSAAICIFMAYRLIPLADATTIQFSSPVLVIFLAVFILKEPLTILQGITGIVTFFGVIIISKPDFIFGSNTEIVIENRTEGLIFSIVAAFSTASVMIILRKLKTTPVPVVICWFSIVAMAGSMTILFAWDQWKWPFGWDQYGLLLGIGCLGIFDQFFMTIALHYESAGPVAITRTLNIVLAFVYDILVLNEEFDWTSIVGACLVTFCITVLGISRWKHEKPEQFEQMKQKCCACGYGEDQCEDECEVLIVRKDSQRYYDSIDDKRLNTPQYDSVLKQIERNDSSHSFGSKDEIIVDKNS